MKKEKRHYPTPALEKGLDILELFAHEPAGLTKSDVARSLNRTVSEIFRMLLCLEDRGYIARTGDDERFRLTLKTFRMSLEYPPTKRLVSESLPIMQEIVHTLNQSCHLGVLEQGQVVILSQAESPVSPAFSVRAGSVVDLMHASTGHVILAYSTKEVRTRAIDLWQQQTGNRVPRDFEEHLSKIEAQGYEERESYQIKGVINISYPVLDAGGNAMAALTVPFLPRMEDTTTTKLVRAALRDGSTRLSETIGGRPHHPASQPEKKAVKKTTTRG